MRYRVLLFGALACSVTAAPSANAAPLGLMLPAAAVLAARSDAFAPCKTISIASSAQSKAEALLGGAPSALSRIMGLQERVTPAATPAAASLICATTETGNAGGTLATVATGTTMAALPVQPRGDDFLSSSRLAVSHTPFDRQWGRVSGARLKTRAVARLHLGPTAGDLLARMEAVNAWANGHIRYEEDDSLYGRPDYWANAAETLSRRAGDCEDIAILKYQLLAAAGVPREAMFLTVARDLVRHADHAILLVRDGEKFWLLDNSTNALIDGGSAQGYRPIFSYNNRGKWLHGYRGELAGGAAPVPAPALNAR